MSGLLPPIIAQLIADTREYMIKMTEAQKKMGEFGASADATGAKFTNFANKASTAVLGVGVALGAYAVVQAYKFKESLDAIHNQTNLTKTQTDALGQSIIKISDATGQTTADLAQSAITIEQAGISGAKATTLLNDAAKAAVITNASVADTTKAIVSAQTLQIAKGMDVTKLTGILVKGSKDFVGGLQAEEQMLSGKVGVSLANYGLGLKTVIPLGAEFAKVGLPTRSIASFTTGLGNLEKPLTDTKGKLSTYAKTLEQVGVSQQTLVADLRKGDIVGLLTNLKDAAGGSGAKLTEMLNAVFGTSGSATASVLIKNLSDLSKVQKNLSGAGADSFAQSFKDASQQLGPQLKILQEQLKNALVPIGQAILPAAADVLRWTGEFANALKTNSTLRDVLGIGAATTFAAAVGIKLKSLYNTIFGTAKQAEQVAQGQTQIGLLTTIAENTGIMAGEGGIRPSAGGVPGAGAGISSGTAALGTAVVAFSAYAITQAITTGFALVRADDQLNQTRAWASASDKLIAASLARYDKAHGANLTLANVGNKPIKMTQTLTAKVKR